MSGFRKGDFRILVATDVAARGLDIPEVDVIVQLSVRAFVFSSSIRSDVIFCFTNFFA